MRHCPVCDEPVVGHATKKYCSKRCSDQFWWRRKHPLAVVCECAECGAAFCPSRNSQRFCSTNCGNKSWRTHHHDHVLAYRRSYYERNRHRVMLWNRDWLRARLEDDWFAVARRGRLLVEQRLRRRAVKRAVLGGPGA